MRFPLARWANVTMSGPALQMGFPIGWLPQTATPPRLFAWTLLTSHLTNLICYAASSHSRILPYSVAGQMACTLNTVNQVSLATYNAAPWAHFYTNPGIGSPTIFGLDLVVDDPALPPLPGPGVMLDLPGDGWAGRYPGPGQFDPDTAASTPLGINWRNVPVYADSTWNCVFGAPVMLNASPALYGIQSSGVRPTLCRILLKDLTAGVADSEASGSVPPPTRDILYLSLQALRPTQTVKGFLDRAASSTIYKWVHTRSLITVPSGILSFGIDSTALLPGTSRNSLYYQGTDAAVPATDSVPKLEDGQYQLHGITVPVGDAIAFRVCAWRSDTASAATTTWTAFPAVQLW